MQKQNQIFYSSWRSIHRATPQPVSESPRRPAQILLQGGRRGFQNLRLRAEHVAEIRYRSGKCNRDYRLIITRKTIDVHCAQEKLWEEYRYFFYITNDWQTPAAELVLTANGRCNQENLIAQLKNGVHAMRLPVNDLISNWAYMVMASLAWTLKAWWGLMLPEGTGRHRQTRREQKHHIDRFMSYSPWQEPLLAAAAIWRTRSVAAAT